MVGTITMKINGEENEMSVSLRDVDLADKCAAVDCLLDGLNAHGVERLFILSSVMNVTKKEIRKERAENESGCFRN